MDNLDKKMSNGVKTKKITTLVVAVIMLTAGTAFAVENYDYDSTKSNISPTPVPTINPLSPPPPASLTAIKKCGVNTFNVSNECGAGAFKNLYFQCYDGYVGKLGGENSCKSSGVWSDYARSVCANRCGAVSTSPSQGGQVPTTITTKPLPRPAPDSAVTMQEVKPIAICYIPDKLTKDYNRLLVDLRKAEVEGDKETAGEIIKKITALKLEIGRYREKCIASTSIRRPAESLIQPSTEVSLTAPIAIDRCREVAQWENKIAYYEKLAGLSGTDLKEQTGFSREEIERILSNLPNGLEKVRVQCEDQRDFVEKRSLGTFSTEILSMDLKSIAEPVKPVVVESGQEIDDYYKARIEKITSAEGTENQIQNLRLLKEEINELIMKLIKGRKEIEASELSNAVTEIRVSRGEIRADDVVIKTTDKKILVNVGDKPISIIPTARRVEIIEIKDGDDIKVTAAEISIKDNILRVGNSEVKFTAGDVIEIISERPGRPRYSNIVLKKGIALAEENGRAVYKIKETEPRKLFRFIPIQITKTLTVSAETSDVLNEKLPWYAFLTAK